jgi:hypothetical protein
MAFESPVTVLFDTEGTELAATASQSGSFEAGTAAGLLVMGSGSSGAQFLKLGTGGDLFVTGTVEAMATFAANTPVSQGLPGAISDSWNIVITDGTQVLGTGSSAPLFVSGTVALQGINTDGGALVVTGSVVLGEQPIEVSGVVSTRPAPCTTTVVTGFGASTSNVTVLTANQARCGASFFMDGGSLAYIKLGAGASTTSFTVRLNNQGYFEIPSNYTGQVDVIFNNAAASNVLRITEIND